MSMTVFKNVKAFCTTQGNAPAKGLALVLHSMDHMIAHRDWDALAYFLGHAPAPMRSVAKRIVRDCLGGVTYDSTSKVAKAHRCKGIFTMGDNFGPTDRMETLRRLVADGAKITGKEVKEAFPEAPKADKAHAEKVKLVAKALLRRLEADGIRWEEIVSEVVGAGEPNF